MLIQKNAKAYAILAILRDLCGEDEWRDFLIESYHNGREEGFAIWTCKGDTESRLQRKPQFRSNRDVFRQVP